MTAREAIDQNKDEGMRAVDALWDNDASVPVSDLRERRVGRGLRVVVDMDDDGVDQTLPLQQQMLALNRNISRERRERRQDVADLQQQISQERIDRAKWVLRNTACQVLMEPVRGMATEGRASTIYQSNVSRLNACAERAGCTPHQFAIAADQVIARRNATMHPSDLDSDIAESRRLLAFPDIAFKYHQEAMIIEAAELVRGLQGMQGH